MEPYLPILKDLQGLRGEIRSYILVSGIHAPSWVQIRKNLSTAPAATEIDVILCSGGGSAEDAYRMIRAFRDKYTTVNVIVPFWAKSAATLFSFGATRLVLHNCGELGPIDAQIKKDDERATEDEVVSALDVQASLAQIEERSRVGIMEMFSVLRDAEKNPEIVKIGRKELATMLFDYSAKFYAPLLEKIQPMEMGQRARILDIGRMYARRILKQYNPRTDDKQIDALLDFLVYECPDHGYVVDYPVLRSYLPFVMKAEEAPFGPEYSKKLGELSLMLTDFELPWPNINDFLDSLQSQKKSDTMPVRAHHEKENGTASNTKSPESGGLGGKSVQNKNKKVAPTARERTRQQVRR